MLLLLLLLCMQVIPGEVTSAGLNCLVASGLMSGLQQLSLYDSELPAGCLGSWLKGAGRLTSLQLGLSNVDDLAPLGKLPQLQVRVEGLACCSCVSYTHNAKKNWL
jgi:hypothetical protein